MEDATRRPFSWSEVSRLFDVAEDEMDEAARKAFHQRINGMVQRHGREFVIRKIALHTE